MVPFPLLMDFACLETRTMPGACHTFPGKAYGASHFMLRERGAGAKVTQGLSLRLQVKLPEAQSPVGCRSSGGVTRVHFPRKETTEVGRARSVIWCFVRKPELGQH